MFRALAHALHSQQLGNAQGQKTDRQQDGERDGGDCHRHLPSIRFTAAVRLPGAMNFSPTAQPRSPGRHFSDEAQSAVASRRAGGGRRPSAALAAIVEYGTVPFKEEPRCLTPHVSDGLA
jgi:hypothetical protein